MVILKAVWGLVRLVPWWVWPMLALAGYGWHQKGERLDAEAKVAKLERRIHDDEVADQARHATNEEVGRLLKAHALRLENERDEKDRATTAWLERTVRELRNRPERMPAAAGSSCEGATGAQLSRPDAEFLAGEAAEAQRLVTRLQQCWTWIDAVKAARGAAPSGAASSAGAASD